VSPLLVQIGAEPFNRHGADPADTAAEHEDTPALRAAARAREDARRAAAVRGGHGRQTVIAGSPRAGQDELGTRGAACARHAPGRTSLNRPFNESALRSLAAPSLVVLLGGDVSRRMFDA